MKKIQIILMAVLMAAGMGYSAVLTNLVVNFESDTVGQAPVATAVRPLIQSATGQVVVVTGSAIGTGNAARFVDASTESTGFEYNFVASSNHQENAVGVKFQYSQRSTNANGVNMNFGIGEYSTDPALALNSGLRRLVELQIRTDGSIRSSFSPDGIVANTPLANMVFFQPGTVHTVELFANDKNSGTVSYLQNGTNYNLNANSVALWIDGVNYGGVTGGLMCGTNAVDFGTATVATTEWNLGRIGFVSAGAASGFDVDFDNIQVTALIPEPATMGMLLLGAVTVFAVRRRRA